MSEIIWISFIVSYTLLILISAAIMGFRNKITQNEAALLAVVWPVVLTVWATIKLVNWGHSLRKR